MSWTSVSSERTVLSLLTDLLFSLNWFSAVFFPPLTPVSCFLGDGFRGSVGDAAAGGGAGGPVPQRHPRDAQHQPRRGGGAAGPAGPGPPPGHQVDPHPIAI